MADGRIVIGFDVDGVILDYFAGLMEWARSKGVVIGCEPHEVDTYSMARAFPGLSEDDVMEMIRDFSVSPEFGRLDPYPGAVGTIAALVEDYPDMELVAITSAGLSETTRELRLDNLRDIPFSQVHVIPLGASKRAYFDALPQGSIYVDDLARHVRTASEAGLHAVLYRQPYNVGDEHHSAVAGWDELDLLIRNHLGTSPSMAA